MTKLSSFYGLKLSISTTALLAGLGSFAASAQPQMAPPSASGSHSSSMGSGAMMSGRGSEEMHSKMQSGMQKMQQMKPTGDTDRDFAMMMRMHHQQALDMARSEIEHGKSAELKAMARKLVKDQTKEIAQFDAWLKKHP